MWARRDYFPPNFLSLLFFLLDQTRENVIFHPIFHLPCFHSNQTYPKAKSEPSRSLNSEAMSEPSWSIMVETRARAILGNGTLFFFSFFFFLKIKKMNCFLLITQTQKETTDERANC